MISGFMTQRVLYISVTQDTVSRRVTRSSSLSSTVTANPLLSSLRSNRASPQTICTAAVTSPSSPSAGLSTICENGSAAVYVCSFCCWQRYSADRTMSPFTSSLLPTIWQLPTCGYSR